MLSLDPRLPGRALRLRPSMTKFPAPAHRMLEVVNIAHPVPYYLNRLV